MSRIAIVGATGAVGREMLKVLEERAFPVSAISLFATERSVGERLDWLEGSLTVEAVPRTIPSDFDFVLMSAGAAASRSLAPAFAEKGAVVIDNSSAFRLESDVPLVVPEVNGAAAFEALRPGARRIIANPNCSTIQMVVALWPLHEAFHLERVVVSTYQSVSGAGHKGVQELSDQCVALFNHREPEKRHLPHTIAFNSIPAIGSFRADGYTDEEWKLVAESRKIMALPKLQVAPTCVRIPVFSCHSESIHATFRQKVTPIQVRAALARAEGIQIVDRPEEDEYPMGFPLAGTDDVHVGRIRQDPFDDRAVLLWVVADNLRKGAALNAVQILEQLVAGPESED